MEFNGPDNSYREPDNGYKGRGKKTLMEDIEKHKLWIIAAVAVIVIATVFALAYFVKKNMTGLQNQANVAPVSPSAEENKPKPLTPEEIQAALNKKSEMSNANGGTVENTPAPKPLTPQEIQNALNKKVETTGNAGGSASSPKPLSPQEIQDALNKKQ